MATVTLDVSAVTTLPDRSSTATDGEGEIDAPAVVVDGWVVKTSLAAAPATIDTFDDAPVAVSEPSVAASV